MTIPNALRFPVRMPEENIARAYPSIEAAFSARDYFYVARYGSARPELRGCSLILSGNRTGGERILSRHDICTARSFFYRAYGAWRDGFADEALRWLEEGRKAGGETAALDRLRALMARTDFRIVLHSDYSRRSVLSDYLDVPGMDVLLTYHAIGDGSGRLPFNAPLASAIPPGAPIDLVIVDGSSTVPVGVSGLGAAVVLATFDQEWHYDMLARVTPEVDWISINSTTECIEIGQAFGVDHDTYCNCLPVRSFPIHGIRRTFEGSRERHIDLLFTGGIAHDFYQDKRQRLLNLHALPDALKVVLYDGYLSEAEYYHALQSSRFALATSRYSNNWSSRIIENVMHGAITLVPPEIGAPYLLSDPFDCFQVFHEETAISDIEGHVRRYPEMISRVLGQADLIEAELRDLAPHGQDRASRYLRHLLFVRYVERTGRPLAGDRASSRKTVIPLLRDLLHLGDRQSSQALAQHLETLIAGSRPAGAAKPGDWLRFALLLVSTTPSRQDEASDVLESGRRHHPGSLPLAYAHALCHLSQGHAEEADRLFAEICEGRLTVDMDEPFPRELEKLHETYWIVDMRIRERCPNVLEPLVSERAVWLSLAFAHRAHLTMTQARHAETVALARAAVDLFARNDIAQRLLLRGLFALFLAGDDSAGETFLKDFGVFRWWDGLVFHDFAPMAVHILHDHDRLAEAADLVREVTRAFHRMVLPASAFRLYPEAEPLLDRYGIPHGARRDASQLNPDTFLAADRRPS